METKTLRAEDLHQFTGSEYWYRHPLVRSVHYTDGARYVADVGEAHWLLDEIALAQKYMASVKGQSFQVWKLTVGEDRSATLICENGNEQVVHSKTIPFTDFPLKALQLWFENGVIYLPSER